MSKTIFTVTTLRSPDPSKMDERCVGYYLTLEDALECVENNYGDIFENGYYPWAIIEEMPPHLYPHPVSFQWFKWDRQEKKYVACCIPEGLQNTSNYGIG